jgi:cathepsin A (carboxypeptidase C)
MLTNSLAQDQLYRRITSSKKFQVLKKNKSRPKRETKALPDPPPPTWSTNKTTDLVNGSLLGMTFNFPSEMYSGYLHLQGNFTGVYLHYWLISSEGNAATDPLILWLNGGPGCSSLGGLLNELGPLRPSKDGQSLYQNPYAWTKVGSVVFLESPRGVGFSYSSGSNISDTFNNDDQTALMNVEAILSFYDRFPEFRNRSFYITGESYGGVYIPTLTDQLIKRIQRDNLTYVNLKGVAIGNGEMSALKQVSSSVTLLYYKGLYDLPMYKNVSSCCAAIAQNQTGYSVPCDLTQYITIYENGNVTGRCLS